MIESQYGDKTFPSFVKWLVGWRVSYEDLKHNRVKIFLRTFWQEVHTDLCPDPDEDTPVACAFNPHWDQLQQRFLSHYFDLPPPSSYLVSKVFLLRTDLQGHRQVWDVPRGLEVTQHYSIDHWHWLIWLFQVYWLPCQCDVQRRCAGEQNRKKNFL